MGSRYTLILSQQFFFITYFRVIICVGIVKASRGNGSYDVKFDKPIDDVELGLDRCFIATMGDIKRREAEEFHMD